MKTNDIILSAILSQDPRVRAVASELAERERYQLQARVLGVVPESIEEMTALAESVGPRTLLPNGELSRAIWDVMLGYVKRGDAAIPDDRVRFACDIWLRMYYRTPLPDEYTAFQSLVDALVSYPTPNCPVE